MKAHQETARVAREAAASIPVQVEQTAEQIAPVLQSSAPDARLNSSIASSSRALGGAILQAPLSSRALAFLASRNWPTKATHDTARATLIEFEKFCAQQLQAAA